jgi:hypothetical protein
LLFLYTKLRELKPSYLFIYDEEAGGGSDDGDDDE